MTPTRQSQIAEAERFLRQDPVLARLIAKNPGLDRALRDDYFQSLCRSIIGQQVSVAAAMAIYGRFEAATVADAFTIDRMDVDTLKSVGLSMQKAKYIKDLSRHFIEHPEVYNKLGSQTDDEVITALSDIKGIGVWTAQMFLMFTLGRMDVFAPADAGLQRAVQMSYGLNEPIKGVELDTFAERWSPYRTVAAWHLWQSLNNIPV